MFDNDNELDPITGLPMSGGGSDPAVLPPQAPAAASPIQISPQVQEHIAKKFNLGDYSPEKRQALVDDNNGYNTNDAIAGALASLGAGFQGGNSLAAVAQVQNQRRAANAEALNQFDKSKAALIEDEAQDPNSDSSKRFRATLKANFPKIAEQYGAGFDKLTAADQKSVFQVVETKAKLDEAGAKREGVKAFKESQAQDRADKNEEKRRIQISGQDDKDAKALEKTLGAGWAGRSGQAGQVQAKINAAEAVEKLIEQGRNQPNGLDSRQIEEVALSANRMLNPSGGGASARIEALVPHTFWGKTQSLKEYLSNKPQGQDAQAFVDRLAETVKREKDLANTQMRQYQIESLGGHARLKKSNPDLYNDILQKHGIDDSMIDQKGQYKAPLETKTVGGKTYQKVQGGWVELPDMEIGEK